MTRPKPVARVYSGLRLRDARERAGVRRSRATAVLNEGMPPEFGSHPDFLFYAERKDVEPFLHTLVALAELFRCDVTDFAEDRGEWMVDGSALATNVGRRDVDGQTLARYGGFDPRVVALVESEDAGSVTLAEFVAYACACGWNERDAFTDLAQMLRIAPSRPGGAS